MNLNLKFRRKTDKTDTIETFDKKELLIKEIHTSFLTEVDKLLVLARDQKSLQTDKQSLIDKSKRLKSLGFSQTEEIKEAQKEIDRLEALQKENNDKREIINAIEYFGIKYPCYKFITEDSVRKICEKYGLIYGEVTKYKGTVPDANLKQMEEFKISNDDCCCTQSTRFRYGTPDIKNISFSEMRRLEIYYSSPSNLSSFSTHNFEKSPLEIVAPSVDFDFQDSELENFKLNKKIKIPDPIVLQPVFYGTKKYYLIVTAWGDEASDENVVNEKMN